MPEHQKAQKKSQKIQSIQDKRKHLQKKKMLQLKKRCGSYEMMSSRKRSVSFFCRTESRRTRWQMQKWQQNFKKGEGSNASQTGDSCLEASCQQIAAVCGAVGPKQVDALANAVFQRLQGKWSSSGADARKR